MRTEEKPDHAKQKSVTEARAAGLRRRVAAQFSEQAYNLTIGENPRFIWFRNAKVGTRTTLQLLRQAGVTFKVQESFSWRYPLEDYADHFKFAFVRNPWDRLVSGWKNKVSRKNALGLEEKVFEKTQDFESFVDFIAESDIRLKNVHFRSQVGLVDVKRLDFVGRFERFGEDMSRVMETLGMPVDAIPWRNKSNNRRPYRSYYTERTRDVVAELFREDIEAFGYEFGDDDE